VRFAEELSTESSSALPSSGGEAVPVGLLLYPNRQARGTFGFVVMLLTSWGIICSQVHTVVLFVATLSGIHPLLCNLHILWDISDSGLWFNMQGKQLSTMLDEDPALMERRVQLSKRLELFKQARDEIDAVAWAK
jgi:hypothetical protein